MHSRRSTRSLRVLSTPYDGAFDPVEEPGRDQRPADREDDSRHEGTEVPRFGDGRPGGAVCHREVFGRRDCDEGDEHDPAHDAERGSVAARMGGVADRAGVSWHLRMVVSATGRQS